MSQQYAIYKIQITELSEKRLFLKHLDGTSPLEHAREHFASLFRGGTQTIYNNKENGENVVYPNDILCCRDDVYVLRFNNVRMKLLVQPVENPSGGIRQYEEVRAESNPYCYVLIDNRAGIGQIAIEKSSAWSGNTDTVRDLLQKSWRRLLRDYGLTIDIKAKMLPTRFWEFVNHQVKEEKDVIKKVTFDFVNPNRTTADMNPQQLTVLSQFTQMMGGLKGRLIVNSGHGSGLTVDEKAEDLAQMVNLCSNNGYKLSVQFRNHGIYRCNEDTKAFFPLPEPTITRFLEGQVDLDLSPEGSPDGKYGLIQWLDEAREQTQKLDDAKQIPSKPARRR